MTLYVSAVGSGQLNYKWKKDGQEIIDPNCAGIDTAALIILSFSDKNQGSYKCEIKDDVQTINTNTANLEISRYNLGVY